MSIFQGIANALTGTPSGQNLPQIQGPNASNYQINGLGSSLGQLQGLMGGGMPTIDWSQSNNIAGQQQQNVGDLQAQANGTGVSPAQTFMNNNAQANMRNIQAQALSQQSGVNPGLAYRGLMNAQGALQAQTASQGALMQQQNQQQAQLALAQQLNSMRSQDMGQAQATTQNAFQGIQQQAGLNQQAFGQNQAQQQANAGYGQAQTAYTAAQYANALQQQQAQAQSSGNMWHGILGAVGTGVGAVAGTYLGGPMGGMAGASLGSQLGNLAGGGQQQSPAVSPQLAALLSNGGGNSGGFQYSNGMSGAQANASNPGYGTYNMSTGTGGGG